MIHHLLHAAVHVATRWDTHRGLVDQIPRRHLIDEQAELIRLFLVWRAC